MKQKKETYSAETNSASKAHKSQERKKNNGVVLGAPIEPIKIKVAGKARVFAMDDPKLPDWIEDRALACDNFPYEHELDRERYEKELRDLQVELVKAQISLQMSGKRVLALFEGRDAAGKNSAIFTVRQFLNPRFVRDIALTKPTPTEAGQWYFQRYIAQFPTAGEIVLFNRSWYNRAGVEPVMGFCTPTEHKAFLKAVPRFEETIVQEGIHFFKFWLNIGQEMQLKRFHRRRHDPLKIWKLSPMDIEALGKWDDYTAKRDLMFRKTHTKSAPWVVVRANDKARAHLNVIRHLLASLDYEGKDKKAIGQVDRSILGLGPDFLR